MRVLYNNLVESAANLAMTNLDSNSTPEYLYDPYIELACFCTASASVITGNWIDAMTVDSMAIGYHNADFARLILRDLAGDELFNQELTLESGDSIYYFASVQGAYSFEVQLSGGEPIYIGFLSFGEYLELPRFTTGWKAPLVVRSIASKSLGGQVSGVFSRHLRGAEVSLPRITNDKLDEIVEYVAAVQTCKPHMVDLYPEAHDKVPARYAHITEVGEPVKRDESGFYWNMSITYEEAR